MLADRCQCKTFSVTVSLEYGDVFHLLLLFLLQDWKKVEK